MSPFLPLFSPAFSSPAQEFDVGHILFKHASKFQKRCCFIWYLTTMIQEWHASYQTAGDSPALIKQAGGSPALVNQAGDSPALIK
jgi:hypothetical protein